MELVGLAAAIVEAAVVDPSFVEEAGAEVVVVAGGAVVGMASAAGCKAVAVGTADTVNYGRWFVVGSIHPYSLVHLSRSHPSAPAPSTAVAAGHTYYAAAAVVESYQLSDHSTVVVLCRYGCSRSWRGEYRDNNLALFLSLLWCGCVC